MEMITDIHTPEECAALIFECSSRKVEVQGAEDLWHKILQHKGVLSEKKGSCLVTTETFMEIIPEISPTLIEEISAEFELDCEKYTRY